MPFQIILSFCVAALLALNSLSAVALPKPAKALSSAEPAMPCDGASENLHAHETACSMGCDSKPNDGRSAQPWASNPVHPVFSQQPPGGKLAPAYVSLLPALRAPATVSAARAPPALRSATPVDLKVVLLT